MKQAVISATTWILTHAAPVPISVNYVLAAVRNERVFTKTTRDVDLDEHELFIKVVRRLLDAGSDIRGLNDEDKAEVFADETLLPDDNNPISLNEAVSVESPSRAAPKHTTKDKYDDIVVASDFELDLNNMNVENIYDMWGWLYDVVGAGRMHGMSEMRIEVKFSK